LKISVIPLCCAQAEWNAGNSHREEKDAEKASEYGFGG